MKQYLIQLFQEDPDLLKNAKEKDIIFFEMPSFCSGEYSAVIYKDEKGLYINKKDNFLKGCRNYTLIKKTKTNELFRKQC